MARPKKADIEDVEVVMNDEAYAEMDSAAVEQAQQSQEALSVIGYDQIYNRERVVGEAKFYMSQSAEAMFEAGRRLLVLKENELHGDFTEIVVDKLGIPARTAQVMMQATTKLLLNPKLESKTQALALLGKTKIFELMNEADEDLEALVEGGTLAGATLDDIDRMTTRELKAHLRESREEIKTKQKLLDDKNQSTDKIQAKLNAQEKRLKEQAPDNVAAEMRQELTVFLNQILGMTQGTFRYAIKTITEHDQEQGTDSKDFLAGAVAQIQRELILVRDEFGLPDHVGNGKPDYIKWAEEQGLIDQPKE